MIFTSLSAISSPETVTQAMSKSIEDWQEIFQKSMQADARAEQKFDEILVDLSSANTTRNMRDNSFFSLVSNILTLIGAWLMLRLKKRGFIFIFWETSSRSLPLCLFLDQGISWAFHMLFLPAPQAESLRCSMH